MSYHANNPYVTPPVTVTTPGSGTPAPPGFHYMPDGSLMADSAMPSSGNTLGNFNFDTTDIALAGETRSFTIQGSGVVSFELEIKQKGTGKYYNFTTNLFQTTNTKLSAQVGSNGAREIRVVFPSSAAGEQYDIYLFANGVTTHDYYNEVRFLDDSLDINSSTGSTSNLIQKVLYQSAPVTLTLSAYSSTGAIPSITIGTDTGCQTLSRNRNYNSSFPFEITVTRASGGLVINKQPQPIDVLAYVERAITATPVDIPGEDIYPTARDAFTGDDINGAITSGSVVRMDAVDLSAVIAIGDKITTPVMTDTTNGARDISAVAVTMDSAVATKMAVGDRVTGTTVLDASEFTVASLDSTNVFSLSAAAVIPDETTLSFSSKINRSTTTVTVVETSGTATDFTMSQAIQFRDNAPLTFYPRRNYRWHVDSLEYLDPGMKISDDTTGGIQTGFVTSLRDFTQTITNFEGQPNEETIVTNRVRMADTIGVKPTLTRNGTTKVLTTVQPGNIILSEQALLTLGGQTVKIGTYGREGIDDLTDYDVELSNIKAELSTTKTTTTAAVNASTTMPITSKVGITAQTTQTVNGATSCSNGVVLDSITGLFVGQSLYAVSAGTLTGTPKILVIDEDNKKISLSIEQTFADGITLTFPNSIISGIGIDNSVVNPYVVSIASLNLTVSAAQTLESEQEFTFDGSGNVVTITGDIKVNKTGNENATLRFDVDKFLTLYTN